MAEERLNRPQVVLVMVQSVDGRTTRGTETGIYTWTSPEDSQLFFHLIATHHVIIMGRKTYEASRSRIKLRPDALRVVLTHRPAEYASEVVPGQLEFSAEAPANLLQRLAQLGHKEVLLVGGSEITAAFLNASLVDKLRITLEPKIFGAGSPLTGELFQTCGLRLKTIHQLNAQGTLHLEYLIESPPKIESVTQ